MSTQFVFTAFGGPEHQQLIDVDPPQPGPGQLAVRVRAAGVNPFDVKLRQGAMGTNYALPRPMGTELSGTVTAVGEDVTDFAAGDDVLGTARGGFGAFVEDTIMTAAKAVAKPEEIGFAEAATLPVAGATAYDATHQVELEPGQTLLILGAGGGVGLLAAQIGRTRQFRVFGVASESKRKVVEETGATFVAAGESAADRVREIAPEGANLLLDLVGGHALRELSEAAKKPAAIVSAPDGDTAAELGGAAIERTPESLAKIIDVVAQRLVAPHISARYPLDRAAEAIAVVESGHATGKVVLEMR